MELVSPEIKHYEGIFSKEPPMTHRILEEKKEPRVISNIPTFRAKIDPSLLPRRHRSTKQNEARNKR